MTTPILVSGTQAKATGFADFLDGTSANLRRVALRIEEGPGSPTLVLSLPDADQIRWRFPDLRRIPDQAETDELVLAGSGNPVSRLILRDPDLIRAISERAPNFRKRPVTRRRARLLVWAAAAIASVALIILVLLPVMADQLAEFLPPKGEQALGDTTFDQIRAALDDTGMGLLPICEHAPGMAALDRMQTRLTDQLDLPYPITVHVLDHDLVNAFALPGGRIVFFRGLIEAAEDPDEVAAVFAHEIGHVINRDPTRSALRSAGSIGVLGLLFGDFAGGAVVLFLTERLIEANYSQAAESGADVFAHGLLARSGIPPSALALMFDRLRSGKDDDAGFIRHFTSHPGIGDRIASARDADTMLTGVLRPSLNDRDWQALRRICI